MWGHNVRMEVPNAAHVNPTRATFFPNSNEMLVPSTLRVRPTHGRPEILGRSFRSEDKPTINGVLTDGAMSYALAFRRLRRP